MKYTFTIKRMPTHLHVSVTGDNTSANVRRYLRDVVLACAEHRCSRVLVEEHLVGPSLGTLDIFEIVSDASRNAWPTITQIAYVDTNPEHDPTLLNFTETVAVNRGVRIRLFAVAHDAEAWLGDEPEPAAGSQG